jgi:hypothetical protein
MGGKGGFVVPRLLSLSGVSMRLVVVEGSKLAVYEGRKLIVSLASDAPVTDPAWIEYFRILPAEQLLAL